jgi:hypothetical protein
MRRTLLFAFFAALSVQAFAQRAGIGANMIFPTHGFATPSIYAIVPLNKQQLLEAGLSLDLRSNISARQVYYAKTDLQRLGLYLGYSPLRIKNGRWIYQFTIFNQVFFPNYREFNTTSPENYTDQGSATFMQTFLSQTIGYKIGGLVLSVEFGAGNTYGRNNSSSNSQVSYFHGLNIAYRVAKQEKKREISIATFKAL